MGNKGVKIVCYADDAVIISEDGDNLQRLLYRFELAAEKYNMSIFVRKAQSLVIAREPSVAIGGKYLGANAYQCGQRNAGANDQSNHDI